MQVERCPISELTPDPCNARFHSVRNIEAIRTSLENFGQVLPIVVGTGGAVVGGNGTLEAAKQLGWTEIQIVRFAGSREEGRALAVALNRTAELAGWDLENLGEVLVELSEYGIAPESVGFDNYDLEKLFPADSGTRPEPEFRPDRPDINNTAREPTKPLYQYALIFDNSDQELRFHQWISKLKSENPDLGSVAEHIDQHIRQSW